MIPRNKLNKHEIELHINDEITCKLCDKKSSNTLQHRQHKSTVHNQKYGGFCIECQKEYKSISTHNNDTHSGQTFKCDHCEKVFKNKTRLLLHQKNVNGTTTKKQCPECANFYINLNDHIRTLHKGEIKPSLKYKTKCHSCKKQIHNADYESHQRICIPQFQICSLCSIKVKDLEKHLQMKHIDIKCEVCFKILTKAAGSIRSLRNHIYDYHIQDICLELQVSKSLTTKDAAEKESIAESFVFHKSIYENGEFKCLLCKKIFYTRPRMTNHMKYHLKYNISGYAKENGSKSYKYHPCTDCGDMIKRTRLSFHKCVIQSYECLPSLNQGHLEPVQNEKEQLILEQQDQILEEQVEYENIHHKKGQHTQEYNEQKEKEQEEEKLKPVLSVSQNDKYSNTTLHINQEKSSFFSAVPNMDSDDLVFKINSLHEKIKGAQEWLCRNCGKKTRGQEKSKEHVQTHIEGLHFSCSDCGFVAKSKRSIQKHIQKKGIN